MGTSRYRSWSFSRQQAYDWCPRNFFWIYFRKGEPESDFAHFLSLRQSVGQLSGEIVHEAIRKALAQFKFSKVWPDNLVEQALKEYDRRVALSSRVAACLLNQKSPPRKPWLDVHLEYENPEKYLAQGRDRVERCVKNFEASDVLTVIRACDPDTWHDITAPSHERPHIISEQGMGFLADGLRIYTAYDFAVDIEDITYIIDWKTEVPSDEAAAHAGRQLTVYAMWAANENGLDYTRVRIQAAWLNDEPPKWNPQRVKPADIVRARKAIINQDRLEKRLIRYQLLKKKVELFTARREDFPAKAERTQCGSCKFADLCWDA